MKSENLHAFASRVRRAIAGDLDAAQRYLVHAPERGLRPLAVETSAIRRLPEGYQIGQGGNVLRPGHYWVWFPPGAARDVPIHARCHDSSAEAYEALLEHQCSTSSASE